jgi:hypothetical protein
MWIVSNDSFISVVEDQTNPDLFVIRARISGDLENFFQDTSIVVHETEDSDYRFRCFVTKEVFVKQITSNINSIDYTNFKNSVLEKDRKIWYTRIWSIMFYVQEQLYERKEKWWETYRVKRF